MGFFQELYEAFRNERPAPRYDSADVIVLDNFGKSKPSPFAYQTLYGLFEYANLHNKTLIVTSNYSPTQAARRMAYGDAMAAAAIASRLS